MVFQSLVQKLVIVKRHFHHQSLAILLPLNVVHQILSSLVVEVSVQLEMQLSILSVKSLVLILSLVELDIQVHHL